MKKRQPRLKKYAGSLTPEKIAEGINLSSRNAERLLHSAQLLFEAKDYASAISLAILSIEESGKASLLRGLALADDEKSIKECWKDYRTHIKKNVEFGLITVLHQSKISLEDLKPLFMSDNAIPYQLDNLKQLGFYTDCLGDDGHWHTPVSYYSEDDADGIIKTAAIFCHQDKTVTVREIELWKECLKPVWMKTMTEMKQGLILWNKRMREERLVPDDDHFEDFVASGVDLGDLK